MTSLKWVSYIFVGQNSTYSKMGIISNKMGIISNILFIVEGVYHKIMNSCCRLNFDPKSRKNNYSLWLSAMFGEMLPRLPDVNCQVAQWPEAAIDSTFTYLELTIYLW